LLSWNAVLVPKGPKVTEIKTLPVSGCLLPVALAPHTLHVTAAAVVKSGVPPWMELPEGHFTETLESMHAFKRVLLSLAHVVFAPSATVNAVQPLVVAIDFDQ